MKKLNISLGERNDVLVQRQIKVIAKAEFKDIARNLKQNIDAVGDSIRILEKFMDKHPDLRENIEEDLVKLEREILSVKQVARRFRNLKVGKKGKELPDEE